jgi:hypothetical protein
VLGLNEEWAARALAALRVAVVSRNRVVLGERGAGAGVWPTRRCPRLELVSVNAAGGGAARMEAREWSGAAEIYSRRAGLRETSGR